MEDLSKHTPTELLKIINDTKTEHDNLKDDIAADTKQIDDITVVINEKLDQLTITEKKYVKLIEELNNR
jgi:predicted alternative tryptophan synthase beta-subunit